MLLPGWGDGLGGRCDIFRIHWRNALLHFAWRMSGDWVISVLPPPVPSPFLSLETSPFAVTPG